MVLKGRLKLIYDMIPTCDILADIGTDHALLPAYALLNKRCRRAVACDVKTGPLERAKKTLKKYMLEDRMELRIGSGLEPIRGHESDVIVLAGMGGILITRLIEESIDKAKAANCLILQPMTNQDLVRPFLWKQGFEVRDERLTSEGDKLYQVILASYTGKPRDKWERINEVIGEKLIANNDPLLRDWLRNHINKQRKVVQGLKKAEANTDIWQLSQEEKLLNELEDLLISLGG
jgi:tRNA (adenine22-N1)-methyltransferase